MSTLDSSIVNVALPTLSIEFYANLSRLQWVVTAYLLTISSLLPVFGRAADLFGRKRVYTLGFLVFTIGSTLCGLSSTLWFLVASRVLQAVGASMIMSNSFALIALMFPPSERGKALGLLGTVVAMGSLTGPALGGILIGLFGWRSIFYVNIPIGIIGYMAAFLILPADKPRVEGERFDFKGAVLFSTGMISLLLGINNGAEWGWSSMPILLSIGAGTVLLVTFYVNEKTVRHPMIDLSLFKNRPFLIGNLTGWLSFVTMFSNNILLPFYLQQVLHYKPAQVGLTMMAFPLVMAFAAPISGHLSDQFGPVKLTSSGLAIMAMGLFYCSTLSATAHFFQVIPGPMLIGLGSGLFQAPNNSSVMSSVEPQKLGIAGSINSLVRNVGMVTGIAFSVTLFEALGGISKPEPNQIQGFMTAYHGVLYAATGIAIIGMVLSMNRKSYARSGSDGENTYSQ